MLSTKWSVGLLAALSLCFISGCGSPSVPSVPRFDSVGSRVKDYNSLKELAGDATAIVVAQSTGETIEVPLPDGYGQPDSAPTIYSRMKVVQVIGGTLLQEKNGAIDVVSPGEDLVTGKPGLSTGGPYLLFLTAAVYGPKDPAGGYVAVGGPAGIYAGQKGETFGRVDLESPRLPASIDLADPGSLPEPARLEADVIAKGS